MEKTNRWGDNIKIDLTEAGLGGGGGTEWINLAQDSNQWWIIVNTVMNLWVL
jgi:hypothetical protein